MIHSSSGTHPKMLLPKIYIDEENIKLSNMDDLFLSNVHLSLYQLWVFLDCGSRSDVIFACIGCDSGDT